MKFWAILICIGLLLGGLFYIQKRLEKATVLEAENKIIKTENKEIRHEAQSFANRPRTRADRVNSLCEWAVSASKDEGKPIKRLPTFCSQRSE